MAEEKTCATCRYEENDIYEKPCCDCVVSKRWIKFEPVINYKKWKKKVLVV